MPIHLLPAEVVSRIAAGEVVERPASVVKELVENAIDAAATQITVEVRGGGVELIRVLDNGSGIPAAEAELALSRYATSKITSLKDLEGIATLGFRGEALSSIASVASLELLTRSPQEEVGTYLSVGPGQETRKEPRPRPPGTTVTVRHLFRPFPARLKFLKARSTENSHMMEVVTQYALVYPEIKFTMYEEGRPVLRTSGDGELRQAALEVYGEEVGGGLIEVGGEEGVVPGVRGLISPPSHTRSTRHLQSFFVNRRWVRNPVLSWAVEEAYRGLLPPGKHPIAIVHLTLPPPEVDVNIHPSKAEVKFLHQASVIAALQGAVRRGLGVKAPRSQAPAPSWLPSPPPSGEEAPLFLLPPPPTTPSPILRVLGQVANSYIVAEGEDGVYLIDQHTAHERVLYEKLLRQHPQGVERQGLLEPVVVELSPAQEQTLLRHQEALRGFGFEAETFGPGSLLVRTVPAVLRGEGVKEALQEIAQALAQGGPEEVEKQVATALACHGAVKAGQGLSQEDMRELVKGLEAWGLPRLCPHGRPILVHLSAQQLEKQFGRR